MEAFSLKKNYIINCIIKLNIFFSIFILLLSCQPVVLKDDVIFDNNLLAKFSINAKKRTINQLYQIKFADPYIDYSMKSPPVYRIHSWLDENIIIFGSENELEINIIEASITRIEKENLITKKYEEKKIYYYEVNFVIEFILYNNDKLLLATTKSEVLRSTTSGKFISLNEKDRIIDKLILDGLIDLSSKSDELLSKHMFQYML